MKKLRIFKNKILLNLGFTLINRRAIKIVTVKIRCGRQIKSNRSRVLDYRLDDKGWSILC